MAKSDNLKDYLVDLADAIREKKGTTAKINPQDFASEIASIESGGGNGWTGHADAEGLRAIGWTDEDIAYYQENGVDWNEEDDHLHLVSDDNKALYGVLTADNISSYKDRIVYLPKINITKKTSAQDLFRWCYFLIAIPSLDFTNVTSLQSTFEDCVSLTSIAPLYIPKEVKLYRTFYQCVSLRKVELNINICTEAGYAFYRCSSLLSIVSGSPVQCAAMSNIFNQCGALQYCDAFDTSRVQRLNSSFQNCFSLRKVRLDLLSANSVSGIFTSCIELNEAEISNLNISLNLGNSFILSRDSLLYVINNEAATSPITITLATNVYDKYATDSDVVEALANHPNITLAK
jgi:hypothetical protein